MLIMTGCVSKPKAEIVLPPKPERTERKHISNIREAAELITYYEAQIELWESWGDSVTNIVEKINGSETVMKNIGGDSHEELH